MYEDLSQYEQLLLAVQFHLSGSVIPQELSALLGEDLVADITNPIVNKDLNNANPNNNAPHGDSACTSAQLP